VLDAIVAAIESAGGTVDTEARPGFTLEKADTVFKRLLFAALSGEYSYQAIEQLAALDDPTPFGDTRRAAAMRHREWLAHNERRLQLRERWREFFEHYDVILMPVQPRAAIPHDHTQPQWDRTVDIDGAQRPYLDLFGWTGPAGAGFLPATVVPAGVAGDGLPIGVQIVGPYLHDRTTLKAARLISKLCGGCPRPALAG
jgi:amidase